MATLLGAAAVLGGCGTTSGSAADDDRLTVLAAASLRGPLGDLEPAFEAAHPGTDLVLSFGGSADLADQVEAGAPADVVATADETTMARLSDGGFVEPATTFATNRLTVVVPRDNPAGVTGLADLGRDDVDVVVCAPRVPCGRAADALADGALVTLHRVSEEASVTDVLAKVALGEADAGLVYETDAASEPDRVLAIDTPEAQSVVNRYPVAVLTGSAQPDAARAWVELLTGEEGRAALAGAGFGLP